MRVSPGRGARALIVVLHGAGQAPPDAFRAFRGGWKEPGLVLIALTLSLSNGELFPAIMALSPGGIVGAGQMGVPRVFISHGTLDDVLPLARGGDAIVRQLREAGCRVTYRRFVGGHEVPAATSAAAIRWFLAG